MVEDLAAVVAAEVAARHLQRGDQLAVLLQLDPLLEVGEVVADQDERVRPRQLGRVCRRHAHRPQLDHWAAHLVGHRTAAAEAHLDAPLAREERRVEDVLRRRVGAEGRPEPRLRLRRDSEERLERRRRVREPRVAHALGGPRRQLELEDDVGDALQRERSLLHLGLEPLLLGDVEELDHRLAVRVLGAAHREEAAAELDLRRERAVGEQLAEVALELLGTVDRALQVGGSGGR